MIREQFDIRDLFAIRKPISNPPIKAESLTHKIRDIAIRVGIRSAEEIDISNPRGTIRKGSSNRAWVQKIFHTELIESDLKTELRWLLEGHNLKANDSNYVRTTEKRLQQEYEKVIDNLTINEENRLKRKVEVLKIEKSRIDMLEAKMQKLERKHGKII